ncbi:TetR/AcrR family transcriptional regulator C-terminal domain-containing protein [Micromonospora sp. HM5-17]|uniref:TetR/AcrR family transcriptional regulator C-terminal domain-containing protein n=1 Tax=Micromonospora sp. HM5-17 TaxID=2487710 RepID=UPI000F47C7CC|nr:TetR/AcrR family transcriptional regulator C-terminal domain-containing protein [Micromonospora sp. HM5-17]ROT29399.1 hypothetical protein EF879_20750 [Micromonospora sp. HM5-17]
MIAGLANLGLTDQERLSAVITLDGFVTGFARHRIQYDAAVEESGISDEEFWNQHFPTLVRAMESGNFPAMAALNEDAFDAGWDESFEFGLQRLLDGIAALVAARAAAPAASGASDASSASGASASSGPSPDRR